MREEATWGLLHAFLLLITFAFPNQYPPPTPIYLPLSVAVFLGGTLVFGMGWRDLGVLRFGIEPPDTLVTTGIYATIRNPIYLGLKILLVGIAMIGRSLLGAILTVIFLVPLHRYRAQREEQALQKKFGERYLEYRKQTLF